MQATTTAPEVRRKLAKIREIEASGGYRAATIRDLRRQTLANRPIAPFAYESDRPPLPPAQAKLLRDGTPDGYGEEMAIAFAAYCAGWTPAQLGDALLDEDNLTGAAIRGRDPEEQQEELGRLWRDAKSFATRPVHKEKAARAAARARVEEIRQTADALLWLNEDGLIDLYVLHAFLATAERFGRTTVTLSVRQLAREVVVSRQTAHEAVKRLAAEGWLQKRNQPGRPVTYGEAWSIGVPKRIRQQKPRFYAYVPPLRQEVTTSDAFGRKSLGKATLHTWRVMAIRPKEVRWTAAEVGAATGVEPHTASERLLVLRREGLVTGNRQDGYAARGLPQYRKGLPPVRLYLRSLRDGTEGGQEKRDRRFKTESQAWQLAAAAVG